MNKLIKKIGIFDSGIGGLTILEPLLAAFPAEYIYLADTAFAPYGNKSLQDIQRRTQNIIHYFENQGVDLIIIACHTASAVTENMLSSTLPIITILECALAQLPQGNKVAVLATALTVKTQVYKRAFEKELRKIDEIACPNLASEIENAYPEHTKKIPPSLHTLIPQLSHYETIILGCTHYNAILGMIRELLPAAKIVATIDISEEIRKFGKAEKNASSCTFIQTSTLPDYSLKIGYFIPQKRITPTFISI